MIEYKTIGYIALGTLAAYITLRVMGQRAINKLINAELEHVINHKDHKVKGKYE